MKNLYLFILFLLAALTLFAQEPAGYYSSAENKSDAALKTALAGIVGNHTEISYPGLWAAFASTDKRADGKVWDIYSNTTNYTFGTNQCGNYNSEGDCYNREHSFPKSWFSNATPMHSDLFHLYPSDGKVNGMRSNYPFGEVGSVTYASNNNYCRLGASNFPGYTGTVFEPADELKGDMARTYFYMVTAYESRVSGWSSEHLDGSKYPALNAWSVALLLRWHRQDPVSSKEINRNNVIYNDFQHNRNPFIDHPELAEYIWGNKKGSRWTLAGENPGGNCENLNFSALTNSITPFTRYSASGDQVWNWSSYKYVMMTGYTDGTNHSNEDWLISPSIDLTNYNDIKLTFDHVTRYFENPATDCTVWTSTNYVSGSPLDAIWTQLNPPAPFSNGGTWNFNTAGIFDLSDYSGKKINIAFKYLSTNTRAGTWEIKNFLLTGVCNTSGVVQNPYINKHGLTLKGKSVTINNLQNEDVAVYDVYGHRLAYYKSITGEFSLTLPSAGVYVLKAGSETLKTIVK